MSRETGAVHEWGEFPDEMNPASLVMLSVNRKGFFMKTIRFRNIPSWMHFLYAAVFFGLAGLAVLSIGACGDDDDPVIPPVNAPVIGSVDKTVVAPGDTLSITGENFGTPASVNRVTFNNSLGIAVPFYASATNLIVVVPQNAATGGMTVTSNGIVSDPTTIEVVRDVGDVWTMSGTGLPYTFKLPNPTGTARYLVVPHSATASAGAYGYAVTPGETSVYPEEGIGFADLYPGEEEFAYRFDRQLREEAIEYLKLYGAGKRFAPNRVPAQGPPDTTTFLVLNSADPYASSNPAYFTTVTAALRYNGNHTLVYSDINNYSGANGFNQSDYDDLGLQFDSSTYPTDVGAFGGETDIDGNGKVVVLFTRVVNSMTADPVGGFISGFFLLNDLGPGVFPAGTTNGMEIFYTLVPDTTGNWKLMSKSAARTIASETLAHEFQHMISFGYRFVTLGGGTDYRYLQQTWLEEGISHIAEDLNGMPDGNVTRVNMYLDDPGATSLMLDDATLRQRGGIFLFMRYLGDRYGNSIFKSIVRSNCVGTTCIQNATGKDFFSNVSDFFAALYLSNSAVPHDAAFDYVSINYPADFDPLPVETRSVAQGQFSGYVMNAAGDYYIIRNINDSALTLTVSSGSSATVRYLITRIE